MNERKRWERKVPHGEYPEGSKDEHEQKKTSRDTREEIPEESRDEEKESGY